MTSQMQRLPTELIQAIIECCWMHNAKELASLCLVCSTVHNWVKPLLYHTVRLSTKKRFTSFASPCAVKQGGVHTRSLFLDFMLPELAKLHDLLHRLQNLQNLRISATDLPYVASSLRVSHLYVSGALRAQPDVALPHITHLFLEDPRGAEALRAEQVRSLFPNLTHAAFTTRPCRGSFLRAMTAAWLSVLNVRRVTVCVVFDDAPHRRRIFAQLLGELRVMRDERIFVYPTDALPDAPNAVAAVDRKAYCAQLAGAALGKDSFCGQYDVWALGTRPYPTHY
ncbi:hypothetical protein AURDEDRAFT_126438 [Auricularia subglabra TFB-10046 SS5]|nr:hypothetical protein AURDEDRAFT_126438 [Auricularia subglabra TFB-10046 SS5]